MHITQESFERACSYVIATVREHDGDDHDGIHGALRALGVNPASAVDVAEEIAAGADSIDDARERGGYAFVMGMLVGVQMGRGAVGGEADAT